MSHCCFPRSSIYAFRSPEPDVSALRQPSDPEHDFSLGQDASLQGKADGLVQLRQLYRGWLFQQSNPRSPVFSSSCNSAPGLESPRPLQPQRLGKGPGPFHTHLPRAPGGYHRASCIFPHPRVLFSALGSLCQQSRSALPGLP